MESGNVGNISYVEIYSRWKYILVIYTISNTTVHDKILFIYIL